MTMLRQISKFGALALTLLVGLGQAHAEEIPGFSLSGLTGNGISLQSRLGTTSGSDSHVINREDCESYQDGLMDVTVNLDVTAGEFTYSVYAAEAGSSCTEALNATDQLDGCTVLVASNTTAGSALSLSKVSMNALLGTSCYTDTESTAKIYFVAQYEDTLTAGIETIYVSTLDFTVDLKAPAAPTLTEAAGGDAHIDISWTDDANAAESDLTYTVCWKRSGSDIDSGCTDGITTMTYDITTDVENGVDYEITVLAVDKNGNEGPESAPISGTPQPSQDFWEYYLEAGGTDTGGFCFIATVTYQSPLAAELGHLRSFRDTVLMQSSLGREFVAGYYRWGRFAAAWIADKPALKTAVQFLLVPLVWTAKLFTSLPAVPASCVLAIMVIGIIGLRRRWTAHILRETPQGVRG